MSKTKTVDSYRFLDAITRKLVESWIALEEPRTIPWTPLAKPLTDARIAEILGEQGIVVARRTVAKYRESLHIPPVALRKSL